MTAIDPNWNPLAAYWNCSQGDKADELDALKKAKFEAFQHLEHVIHDLPRDDTPEHRPLEMSEEQKATYRAARAAYDVATAAVAAAQVEDQLCQQRYTVPNRRANNPPLNPGLKLEEPKITLPKGTNW